MFAIFNLIYLTSLVLILCLSSCNLNNQTPVLHLPSTPSNTTSITHGRYGNKKNTANIPHTLTQSNLPVKAKPLIKANQYNFISDLKALKFKLKTVKISYQTLIFPLKLDGIITPELGKEVDVAARISGRVKQILVRPGLSVKKHDVLALIDSQAVSDLQAELIEAKSKLQIAKASELRERKVYEEQILRPKALIEARTQFNEAKVQKNLALANLNRVEGLYKEKIAAAKDYIQARALSQKAQALYEQAEMNLQREDHLYQNKALMQKDYQLAQAESLRALDHLNTLAQRLEFMGMTGAMLNKLMVEKKITGEVQLRAPVSGIISNFDLSAGEIIEAQHSILKITDLSKVDAKVDVPETNFAQIKIGNKVLIYIDSYRNLKFPGVVSYISDRINLTNHTVAISSQIENTNNLLKANMKANVIIDTIPVKVLACPKKAIHTHEGKKFVYKDVENGFQETEIITGRENEKYSEVISGLSANDLIASNAKLTLQLEKIKMIKIIHQNSLKVDVKP